MLQFLPTIQSQPGLVNCKLLKLPRGMYCGCEYICLYTLCGTLFNLFSFCHLIHPETQNLFGKNRAFNQTLHIFISSAVSVLSLCSGSAGAGCFCQVYGFRIRYPTWKADDCPGTEGHTRSHFSNVLVIIANKWKKASRIIINLTWFSILLLLWRYISWFIVLLLVIWLIVVSRHTTDKLATE